MRQFKIGKIVRHYWNSTDRREAGRDDTDEEDNCGQKPPSPPPKKPDCPNVPRESGENIYVLKNCDLCHDYTVRPCRKCSCPLRKRTGQQQQQPVKSRRRGSSSDDSRVEEPSTTTTMTATTTTASIDTSLPKVKKKHRRHSGGTCAICQLCGQNNVAQPTPPGGYEGMCIQCNAKIQNAINNYYVQQDQNQAQPQFMGLPPAWQPYQQVLPHQQLFLYRQGQRNPKEQPSKQVQLDEQAQPYQDDQPLQKEQLYQDEEPLQQGQPYSYQPPDTAVPNKEQPFNIIVLQDCNNNALIDQLTTAISRIGTNPQANPPPFDYNPYMNAGGGGIEYQYLNLNEPPPRQAYDPYNRRPYYGPMGMENYENPYAYAPDYPRPYQQDGNPNKDERNIPNQNLQGNLEENNAKDNPQNYCNSDTCQLKDTNACTCDCGYCRKGFETNGKLAELIAKALEIFIRGSTAKEAAEDAKKKKLSQNKAKRKVVSKTPTTAVTPKNLNERDSMIIVAGSKKDSFINTGSGMSFFEKSKNKSRSGMSLYEKSQNKSRSPGKRRKSKTSNRGNGGNESVGGASIGEASFGGASYGEASSKGTRSTYKLPSLSSSHLSHRVNTSNHKYKEFFLPICEDHDCKTGCGGRCAKPPHDCSKGCKGCCRAGCSKATTTTTGGSGAGGDGSNRTRQINPRHARCFQCNSGKPGHRQWHEYDGDTCPMRQKDGEGGKGASGGGRCCGGYMDKRLDSKSSAISKIAHYRPGMMDNPVNYIIDGAHSHRSSLTRTAAGVTLQQEGLFQRTSKHAPHSARSINDKMKSFKRSTRKWL